MGSQETSLPQCKRSRRKYSSDSGIRPRTVHILKETAQVQREREKEPIWQDGTHTETARLPLTAKHVLSGIEIPNFKLIRHVLSEIDIPNFKLIRHVLSEIDIPNFKLIRRVKSEHQHLAYRITKTAKDRAIRIETKVAAARIRQEIGENRDKIKWTLLLKKMKLRTPPAYFRETTLRVGGSDEALARLERSLRGDTKLGIVPGSRSMSGNHYNVTLKGSVEVIQAAERILANPTRSPPVQPTEEVFIDPAYSPSDLHHEQDPFQSDSSHSNSRQSQSPHLHLPHQSVFDGLVPAQWTVITFAQYVRDIIKVKLPRSVQRQLKLRDIIIETLQDLFDNLLGTEDIASLEACHDAISFLMKHQQTPAARDLTVRMEQMGCLPTTDTFNIHFRGCAREQNFHSFDYLLEVLRRRGLEPNCGTWIALLQLVRTAKEKQKIMLAIHQLGFPKESKNLKLLAVETIPYTIGPFLDDGGSISAYVETFDKLYGPSWSYNKAVHCLLDALGARGCITEAVDLIDDFRFLRDYIPNEVDVTVLLYHCSQHRTADIGIWLVHYATVNWHFEPDHVAFIGLFRLAWRSRMYNVSRVIWKYACAQGQLDQSMQQTIYHSLVQSLEPNNTTNQGRWIATAASVICGTEPSDLPATSPLNIVDGERKIYGTRHYTVPFHDMLNEALILDRHWTSKGVRGSKNLAWKVHHAIFIPSISMSQYRKLYEK